MVFNFLRFRQRPPGKTPPPNDRVDVFHDPEAGKLVARDSKGNPVLFDATGEGVSTDSLTTSNGSSAAAAGKLGELLSNEAGAELTNYTAATIGTITLTPGEWDVEGLFYLEPNAASISLCSSGISTNSAVPSGFPNNREDYLRTTTNSDVRYITPPKRRFRVTANTSVNLVVVVSFSAGTVSATGVITARRVC